LPKTEGFSINKYFKLTVKLYIKIINSQIMEYERLPSPFNLGGSPERITRITRGQDTLYVFNLTHKTLLWSAKLLRPEAMNVIEAREECRAIAPECRLPSLSEYFEANRILANNPTPNERDAALEFQKTIFGHERKRLLSIDAISRNPDEYIEMFNTNNETRTPGKFYRTTGGTFSCNARSACNNCQKYRRQPDNRH
jgi:hypothetical protein